MRSLEEFFSERNTQALADRALTSATHQSRFELHPELRQAANRGFEIFPVPEIARLAGQQERLIGEATSDISRLEDLAGEYPFCGWRVALGPSRLCLPAHRRDPGRVSIAALSPTRGRLSHAPGAAWRYGLGVLSASQRPEASFDGPEVGARCFPSSPAARAARSPPSGSSTWLNPSVEIEAVPHWLAGTRFRRSE